MRLSPHRKHGVLMTATLVPLEANYLLCVIFPA